MPFSAARGGVGSAGEGGGKLRWGRRERSRIIRHRPRSYARAGAERPQQAGGRAVRGVRSGRRQGWGAGAAGPFAPSAPSALPPPSRPPSAHRAPAAAALRGAVRRSDLGRSRRPGRAARREPVRGGRQMRQCGVREGAAVRPCVPRTGGIGPWQRFQRRLRSVPRRFPRPGAAVGGLAPRGSSCPSELADGPVGRLCLSFSALSSFRVTEQHSCHRLDQAHQPRAASTHLCPEAPRESHHPHWPDRYRSRHHFDIETATGLDHRADAGSAGSYWWSL
ncbi:translation initiation factor IF-2-like [Pyrgilauda ruficollis]|uniref:translation initiation factor IF-2-like n=1 Tax=Pyrgilauda ruficollis TaxID=221976 RepID=UPI001B87D23D|nr:translation initiation factor IF-2-like [Pyrgilauda ruficollis]